MHKIDSISKVPTRSMLYERDTLQLHIIEMRGALCDFLYLCTDILGSNWNTQSAVGLMGAKNSGK
jgi:hypothetical protein